MRFGGRRGSIFSKIALIGALVLTSIPYVSHAEKSISDEFEMKKIAGYSTGLTDEDGGVAEIVKYNQDNEKLYVINGKNQTIDVVSLQSLTSSDSVQNLQKEKSIDIANAVNNASFTYGDLTSITINTGIDIIVAAVQAEDYATPGKLVVMDYDGQIQKVYEAGVQPDMVTITADGKYILSADEGEPRQGLENGVDPQGSITIVELSTGNVSHVTFSDEEVIADDVFIRNNGTKADAIRDFEPEYIAISSDNTKAYVTLQENNAIATIDIATKRTISVKSLGYKDHSLTTNELDASRNDRIEIERLPLLGSYMPDGIASYNINGVEYLVTANEGDATEWEEFVNIADLEDIKDQLTELNPSLFKGMTTEEVEVALDRIINSGDFDKLEVLTDRGNDALYTLGGRSFSIWRADTMEQVYDSGSDFETITAERLPDYFNWSNDDDAFEKRSAKKGPEPEDVKIGIVGDEVYAFVGLERISGVMTYNITDPANAEFANYINSRDFRETIAGDVSPEGLEFVSAAVSPTNKPLVIVGNEVSGTVAVYELQVDSEKPIESISLNQTMIELYVGETATLSATIYPDDTTDSKKLNWSTGDERIATVTDQGVITAIGTGTTEINVITADGKHIAGAIVTVFDTPIPQQENNGGSGQLLIDTVQSETNTAAGEKLPNTSTQHYQYLILGLFLVTLGGIYHYVILRKKSMLKRIS